jgi:hypothetical protein
MELKEVTAVTMDLSFFLEALAEQILHPLPQPQMLKVDLAEGQGLELTPVTKLLEAAVVDIQVEVVVLVE